ncbi:MAG: hypothetical protein ACREQ9_15035, partial [Candidatus Binatia bacterium]
DVRFHNLVTSYLVDHPSTHPSVRYLGRHLAQFIGRHELSTETPWLADLARLEWAILEAFDGPDAEPLDAARLRELPPDRWASARFRLAPTLAILKAGAPVQLVWIRATDGEAIPPIDPEPTILRVWRKELAVLHRAIAPTELAALEAVLGGEDFAGVCEAAAAVVVEGEVPQAAARTLHGWFADGLVVGID